MTRLRHLLAVRPEEARLVGRMAALFAVVEAARGVGEIGADTLVLGQIGPGALPYLYVGLGLTSLVAALAFGAAVGRLRRGPLFVGLLVGGRRRCSSSSGSSCSAVRPRSCRSCG